MSFKVNSGLRRNRRTKKCGKKRIYRSGEWDNYPSLEAAKNIYFHLNLVTFCLIAIFSVLQGYVGTTMTIAIPKQSFCFEIRSSVGHNWTAGYNTLRIHTRLWYSTGANRLWENFSMMCSVNFFNSSFYLHQYDERSRYYQSCCCCCCGIFWHFHFWKIFRVNKAQIPTDFSSILMSVFEPCLAVCSWVCSFGKVNVVVAGLHV